MRFRQIIFWILAIVVAGAAYKVLSGSYSSPDVSEASKENLDAECCDELIEVAEMRAEKSGAETVVSEHATIRSNEVDQIDAPEVESPPKSGRMSLQERFANGATAKELSLYFSKFSGRLFAEAYEIFGLESVDDAWRENPWSIEAEKELERIILKSTQEDPVRSLDVQCRFTVCVATYTRSSIPDFVWLRQMDDSKDWEDQQLLTSNIFSYSNTAENEDTLIFFNRSVLRDDSIKR